VAPTTPRTMLRFPTLFPPQGDTPEGVSMVDLPQLSAAACQHLRSRAMGSLWLVLLHVRFVARPSPAGEVLMSSAVIAPSAHDPPIWMP
jgi:hypothetical protein